MNDNYSLNNSLQYDIDTCLFFAPFVTGCGFNKASGLLASLKIKGTVFTKALFYNHQPVVTRDIMKVTASIIKEAQQAENKATILHQLRKIVVKKIRHTNYMIRGY